MHKDVGLIPCAAEIKTKIQDGFPAVSYSVLLLDMLPKQDAQGQKGLNN